MDEGLGSKAVVPVGVLKDKLNRLLKKIWQTNSWRRSRW